MIIVNLIENIEKEYFIWHTNSAFPIIKYTYTNNLIHKKRTSIKPTVVYTRDGHGL